MLTVISIDKRVLLTGLFILFGCGTKDDLQHEHLINEAITSIEACLHWAGETGDQTAQRNQQIQEGMARDCASAKQNAKKAEEYVSQVPALASKILLLIDLGHYDVDEEQKRAICESAKTSVEGDMADTAEGYAYRAVCL